jgi:calcineurin-like phosphoesterase family protein
MPFPYFISDLHFDHKRILHFSGDYRGGSTVAEHDEWLIDKINSRVGKRDFLYVLGDVAFSQEGLAKCDKLRCCNKILIPGNHDKYPMLEYLKYFQVRPGLVKYKGFWLSHAPVHPAELRDCCNVHGHVHHQSIDDDRYINVCVEALGGVPISLDEIREKIVC